MEFILFILVLGGFFAYWLVTVQNRLHKLREPVRSADATLNGSLQRKRDLGEDLERIAANVASHEASIHAGVASAMIEAAREIAQSNRPALIMADLAARFPTLNNLEAFSNAQRSAMSIESAIDDALSRRNRLAEGYNSELLPFPTNVGASFLGFDQFEYRSESRLRAPQVAVQEPQNFEGPRRPDGVFRENLKKDLKDVVHGKWR